MALLITEECINCDVCEPQCPNQAIYFDADGTEIYAIDPQLCTECVGHYDEPQCQVVCPVECILPNPAVVEDRAALLKKYVRLTTVGDAVDACAASTNNAAQNLGNPLPETS